MKQNKYDDPDFFAHYSAMLRSVYGLESAGEWPAFRNLLPELRGKNILDLGCGFGWHCRYARQQGARYVLGIDLSEKMLARAREATNDAAIEYQQCAIEDVESAAGQFNLVISSLALHYVKHYDAVCQNVFRCLKPGGSFVFSVEHPIFTARAAQEWHLGPAGERVHWPVDDYQNEGPRHTNWLGENVLKYHRTMATYVNTLTGAGFHLISLLEPQPTEEMLAQHPEWKDESRRPMLLLFAGLKPEH